MKQREAIEPGQKNRLDEFINRPKRAVWIIALPMMAGFMVYAAYSIVDMAFVGQLGPMALAALTFVGALIFAVTAVGVGFNSGVIATIAHAVGARDHDKAGQIASNSLGMGFLIGATLGILGLVGGRYIMPILGAEGESVELALEYFHIISIGLPLMFLSGTFRSIMTGEGDAKTPMIVIIVSQLLNVALDPIFIFTLGMGIRGAAIATVVSQIFSIGVLSYIVVVKKKTFVRINLNYLRPYWALLKPIAKIGVPVMVGQLVMALGIGFINRVVAEFGQVAVAGYGAGGKIDLIVALPVLGLAGSTVTVIGMFAGAGRADLCRSTALYTYRWVMIVVVVIGASALLMSQRIIGIFTDDPEAIQIGTHYLKYMVVGYPLMAVGMATGRILQGLGIGLPTLVITAVRVLLIGVPVAYIAVFLFDAPIDWVWLSGILGGIVANVIALWWLREYMWKRDPTLIAAKGRP